MDSKSKYALLLRCLWLIGILTLFANLVAVQEPASAPIQLTYPDQSRNTAYFQNPNENNNLKLNFNQRLKKTFTLWQKWSLLTHPAALTGAARSVSHHLYKHISCNILFKASFLKIDIPPPSRTT